MKTASFFPETDEGRADMVDCLNLMYRYIQLENPCFQTMHEERFACWSKFNRLLKKYLEVLDGK